MSCEDCERIQQLRQYNDISAYYVRVDTADIEVIGCPVHCERVVDLLRDGYVHEREQQRDREYKQQQRVYQQRRFDI